MAFARPFFADQRSAPSSASLATAVVAAALASVAGAAQADDAAGSPAAIRVLAQAGQPFSAVPSADGQWLFVSLTANAAQERAGTGANGIAAVRRDGNVSATRFVPTPGRPFGLVLTHDGTLAIAAATSRVVFLDTARLVAGNPAAVLGAIVTTDHAGSIAVNVTADDRFLFVAEEDAQRITVIDLDKARSSGFRESAIVGAIPVGRAPIALAFSPDQKILYTTSQRATARAGRPAECAAEGAAGEKDPTPRFPQGSIVAIDVGRAVVDPAHSVIAETPAGCNPVRLVLSPDGGLAFVTARKDDALLVFDTAKLVADPAHARLGQLHVGQSPVGIAVDGARDRVYVTSSNRFAGNTDDHQFIDVVDISRSRDGTLLPLGRIPAGAFPRELAVAGDTLIVTNYLSRSVELVDLGKVDIARPAGP